MPMETVRLARQGEIAIATIDNPPVNALGQALRADLARPWTITALARRILVIDQGALVFDGDLGSLAGQAGAGKTIRLQLRSPVTAQALAGYGQDVSVDGLSAQLRVPRAEVSERAARLLADLDVADLTVEDPSIEAIMADLFGHRTPPAPALESV